MPTRRRTHDGAEPYPRPYPRAYPRQRAPLQHPRACTDPRPCRRSQQIANRLIHVCDDSLFDDLHGRTPRAPELLTLALLEEVAAVLDRHGFPPLRGYGLAELTATLYRLQAPHS